ncbi:MAG: pyridoxal phosphate-dependent aminotransferase [Clostridia bacterium]|jgi:alanine-synthesizing transaminase
MIFSKSQKLDGVCYDIRGPVLDEANRMEQRGEKLLKLNIGNPAPFGLFAPEETLSDMMENVRNAQGYCDSKGLPASREAIVQYYRSQGIHGIELDDVYIGNGVSELIMMSMQGLLNNEDEILVPAPDYPLWTAAIKLSGGTPVHYICDEESDWSPDLADLERKINGRTKGIVIINPNNPTGAVYSEEVVKKIVALAEEHGLILFSDEIYDRILYDDAVHTPTASLTDDILCVTFGGLSKSHRIAGFRVGWMVISGNKASAQGYIEGLNMLASMRLCSNVPAQYCIPRALTQTPDIYRLTKPGGRLEKQRNIVYDKIRDIPGLSCKKPMGAFYVFPKVDIKRFSIHDDMQMVLDLLKQEKLLLVQGTGFNWPQPDHFRIVFLPDEELLSHAMERIGRFFAGYRQGA